MEYQGINYEDVIDTKDRIPTGILLSPYDTKDTFVYGVNNLLGGVINFDIPNDIYRMGPSYTHTLRAGKGKKVSILFLGDVMLSKTGIFPQIKTNLKRLLKKADIIVANIEGPVIDSRTPTARGLSLSFVIHNDYFKPLYQCNINALWVLDIANNHICDNSSPEDPESTLSFEETGFALQKIFKNSIVIGAKTQTSVHMVAEIQITDGPVIGIIGWTDVMNWDNNCYKRSVLRGSDISPNKIQGIKEDYDVLIGFPHGNVEQNLVPKPETREMWLSLLGEDKLDAIIGHGPHVIQVAEIFNDCPIFNSIGNFFGPKGRDQTRIGYVPEFNIFFDEEGVLKTNIKNHVVENDVESIYIIHKKYDSIYPKTYDRLEKHNYPMLK